MNKEIEYLLNEMKDTTQDYIGTNGCKYQDLLREEIDLLLSYIEQLETDYKEVNESVTWWTNRFNAIERDNRNLKNNRDKAIEYNQEIIDNYLEEDDCEYCDGRYNVAKKNLNILKGDSDE